MFHRPRTGYPMSSDQTVDETVTDTMAPTEFQPEFQTQPEFQQPTAQPEPKEVESMSNTYNNPVYTNDTATDGSTATQVPSSAAFSPASRGQQTQQQPGTRTPYGYNQGYNPAPEATVSTGRKLVIGEGITLSGEIEACDHLVVEGTVEASLKGASVLDVSQSGMFFGAVEINEATVAGRFEGDIVVNGRLTVRATGTVTGTLSYKELAVEAGATIDGKINPLATARVATTEKKSGSAPKVSLGRSNQDAANELPLANKSTVAA